MITTISAKNYRSLKETTLPLGPLTVLIGANGTGKSNVLDLLELVNALTIGGQSTTAEFERRGGYKHVVWGGDTLQDIEINLGWQDRASRKTPDHMYSGKLGYDPARDVVFRAERLETTGVHASRKSAGQVTFVREAHGTTAFAVNPFNSALQELPRRFPPPPELLESIRNWMFYRFDPSHMKTPQGVSREYALSETGSNLSTVLHALFSDQDPVLDEIVELLQACVPTVEKLLSPIFGNAQTYVALKEKSVPEPVGSWGLSDGTLLALALATAVLTHEPPSLIVLESPDTHLHPYVMETLAEMLKLASQRTQVITTTHSPYLLNYLPPESFVVVEKHEGATECKPVKGRRGMKQVFESLSAGEAWHAGHIGGVP